jgi:hypothetical protein
MDIVLTRCARRIFPNPLAVSQRQPINVVSLTTSHEIVIPLYIDKPICLCNAATRLLVGIKAFTQSTEKPSLSIYFESCNPSFIRTTLVPLGPTGYTGITGITGPTDVENVVILV